MKTRIFCCLLAAAVATGMYAQGGTKSPYSQFGLGVLSDQSQGMNRGMNGVGIAMRVGNEVNTLNPAAYSAVDSLTMLFDAGLSAQVTNFQEGNVKQNGKLANFEYIVSSFRLFRKVGMSFGVIPFTNVGYSYSTSTLLDETNGTIYETYSGSGGLHQAFVGLGWRIFKPLSVGVNASYLWGDINRSVVSSSTSYVNALQKQYSVSVSNYKLDFGMQWEQRIGKKDAVTVGATYGLPHQLKADPQLMVISTNASTSTSDTTSFKLRDGLKLPLMLGAGLSYNHDNRLIVAADATFQRWGTVGEPTYNSSTRVYGLSSGQHMSRYKGSIGVNWTPNPLSLRYFDHLQYRIGAGYSTPYYKINGKDGPSELSVSAGIGIPIVNFWNNRSVLNISGQWVQTKATGFIKENTFRLNIGLTFNERWFAKWRVE